MAIKKEDAFHMWFGGAMSEYQEEVTRLVNSVCISATAAFMAGWEACEKQIQQPHSKPSNYAEQTCSDCHIVQTCEHKKNCPAVKGCAYIY